MTDNELLQKILEVAKARDDGVRTLACAEAFRLAEQYEVSLGDVGRVCDTRKVRIVQCQLGCFG